MQGYISKSLVDIDNFNLIFSNRRYFYESFVQKDVVEVRFSATFCFLTTHLGKFSQFLRIINLFAGNLPNLTQCLFVQRDDHNFVRF